MKLQRPIHAIRKATHTPTNEHNEKEQRLRLHAVRNATNANKISTPRNKNNIKII